VSELNHQPEPPRGADILAVGFGTAVAMWIAGYILHSPVIAAPAWLTFAVLILLLVGGGVVVGRSTRRTWRGGLTAAAVTTATNLLIVGSLYGDLASEHQHMLMVGVPGYMLTSIAAMMIGYAAGRSMRPAAPQADWTLRFVLCAVFATGLVVLAGGLVTGFDAGFAVPDWPSTFNANMFVFPLSRMTGGIYYEHTHRLAGTLVGLIAIALVIHTLAGPSRRSVKMLAGAALAMVCLQGVAGGLWVTDVQHAAAETANDGSAYEATPHLSYVLFHGTFGQVVLGTFVVLAAMRSRAWRDAAPVHTDTASTDRFLGAAFVIAMLIQLTLGVMLRKTGEMLLMHITFAALVALLGIGAGVRAWAVRGSAHPLLSRLGKALLIVLGFQLLLGLLALIFRGLDPAQTVVVGSDAVSSTTHAIATTLHQTIGAVLLALAAATAAWTYHLVRPAAASELRTPTAPASAH